MTRKLKLGKREFDLDNGALIMGILNVTPDSFSDGGRFSNLESALLHARKMVDDGADILDIGGESTRPGSKGVSQQQELDRVIPVIEKIRQESDVVISIDTCKSRVFAEAAKAGADMLNDVTGLTGDPDILLSLKENRLPVIIMHSKGTPEIMQNNPEYDDVIGEIKIFLQNQKKVALDAGCPQVIVDPGIGFGKTLEHNLKLFKHLAEFKELGCPVLMGPSRKSFIGMALGLDVEDRLEATLAASAISVITGADIIRLHDVKEGRRAVDIAFRIKEA